MTPDTFLARFERDKPRLGGDARVREAAAALLRRHGLPDRSAEAWRYTSLKPLGGFDFDEPPPALADRREARLPAVDGVRMVFVDGRYDAARSTTDTASGGSFAAASSSAPLRAHDHPIAALNTMLTEDGAVMSVPDGVDAGTILLASFATGVHSRPVAFHPRHRIRLATGARLTVVETALGDGVYLHNPVTEIEVAEGAHLTHLRLQDESRDAFHLAVIYADVAARGTYDSFSLVLGGRLTRTEIHARLGGANGAVHLNAAQLLRGVQHADFTTVVAHDAPACASRQTVRNVLADRARGVFQGRIEVARIAQKTDGYQMNQALLLSPDAEIDSKPELEIFADDVKCSHGATVGELDAEQLFYLRSRGVPEDEARAILVRAFLEGAMADIAHEQGRAILEQAIDRNWQGAAP